MAVNLSPLAGAGWQFFDNVGTPLAGGLVYTYTAGTTTPQATYTSSAGTIANANPIVLDSAGRTANEVWLTAGVSYKFVIKTSAAVTIGTYDNIRGVNDISASSGSTSITTVGTITNGTWEATPISVEKGGLNITGVPALSILVANVANTYTTVTAAAGQSVRVNTGGTAWEAFAPSNATTTWGGIGSYAVCYYVNTFPNTTLAGGSTCAGSLLYYCSGTTGIAAYSLGIAADTTTDYFMYGTRIGSIGTTSLGFSGTWRCMANTNVYAGASTAQLFVRIS
jgi:hypothetical protein